MGIDELLGITDETRDEFRSVGRSFTAILVDGTALVRGALGYVLDRTGCFDIVAIADSTDDGVRYSKGHRPDLALVGPYVGSQAQPNASTHSEVVGRIREASPETRFLMVIDSDHTPTQISDGLKSGADGVVGVDATPIEFARAALQVAGGGSYVPPRLALDIVRANRESAEWGLTNREYEVVRMIALGHTNAEIADQLVLSVRTVETHRANIQGKLGVTSRAELVRWAIDQNLLAI